MTMLLHGSCAAREGWGVLILGPPGSGKSDLLFRLLGAGWSLVADDQVEISDDGGEHLVAAAPAPLSGVLEVRGLGLLRDMPVRPRATLRLVARLATGDAIMRLPEPESWRHGAHSLPVLNLDPRPASAAQKLGLALDVVLGRRRLTAGFL